MALWSELECENPDKKCEQIKKSLEKSGLIREYGEIIFDKKNESIFRRCYKENKKHYSELILKHIYQSQLESNCHSEIITSAIPDFIKCKLAKDELSLFLELPDEN